MTSQIVRPAAKAVQKAPAVKKAKKAVMTDTTFQKTPSYQEMVKEVR